MAKPKNPWMLHGEIKWINGKTVFSTEYRIWADMRNRCYNKNNQAYANYGGRGIKVCDRWYVGDAGKHPVVCFIEDMGRRPSSAFTLDRKNNNEDYEPNNCRWATRKEQADNKRNYRNSVGLPGAQRCGKKFRSHFHIGGKTIHLGIFETAEEASAAFLQAKKNCQMGV